MSTPTGILRRKGRHVRDDVYFYPLRQPLSYHPVPGSHVALSTLAYAPYLVPTIVTLSLDDQAALEPVSFSVTDPDATVVLSPETMLKHLQAVALALAAGGRDQ